MAPAIDIDGTALVQAAILIGLMLVLKPLLFDPWIAVHEARKAKIDGSFHDAKSLRVQADGLGEEYANRLSKAKESAVEVRSQVRSKTESETAKILADARGAANKALDMTRETSLRDAKTARQHLAGDVDVLAGEVVTKVLGRSVS
jgi:F0F1-type ATP synthase membrane subunit b/b'